MNDTTEKLSKAILFLLDRWLLTPFFIMLILGGLHHTYTQIPATGFGPTWLGTALLIQIFGLRRTHDGKN